MSAPSAWRVGTRQAQACAPSISTVQAPQSPASQPSFVPVRPSSVRRVSAREAKGGASTVAEVPLTVSAMRMRGAGEVPSAIRRLSALHAAQDDGSAGVFLPDFSWSRSDPPAGGAATGRSDAAALMEAGARWHALEAEFARGDEAAVFQQAAAHVLASGPQARTAIAGALENAAHAAWADVAGWLHKAGQAVADTAGPAGPQTHVAATKAQWRRVMIDEKARYSVCGYQPRMERSIGLIYLGMDESDPRYAPWSGPANAAAATIPESEGFERALRLTRSPYTADFELCPAGRPCRPMGTWLPSDGDITLLWACDRVGNP